MTKKKATAKPKNATKTAMAKRMNGHRSKVAASTKSKPKTKRK